MKRRDKTPTKMTQVTKIFYDGQKFTTIGEHYTSLESAHIEHRDYATQQTFEDIEEMNGNTPYLHLMEFRDGEHYNDLYFTFSKEARFASQFN